jgi:hypothetical protein
MILLAYPRSGSTWLRYCIEFLSKRPTGFPGAKSLGDNPVCEKIAGMGVDLSAKPILYKTHNLKNFSKGYDEVIFVVRDYKEVVPRHYKSSQKKVSLLDMFNSHTRGSENPMLDYVKILEQYEKLERRKCLIYYEDLVTKPKETLMKIVEFLNIDKAHAKNFFDNFEYHKKQGIAAYHDTSFTQGSKNVKFHQSKIPKNVLAQMTKRLKSEHLGIFNRYLQRYE